LLPSIEPKRRAGYGRELPVTLYKINVSYREIPVSTVDPQEKLEPNFQKAGIQLIADSEF